MVREKCSLCELNYIKPGEKYCTVCMRKSKTPVRDSDTVELCPSCGIRPTIKGQEICENCLKEQKSMANYITADVAAETIADIDKDEMDGMQIIDELDAVEEDTPEDIKKEFSDEEESNED